MWRDRVQQLLVEIVCLLGHQVEEVLVRVGVEVEVEEEELDLGLPEHQL